MANIYSTVIRQKGLVFLTAVVLAIVMSTPGYAASPEKKINTDLWGVAIKGYDTVAYFIEGRAVKGKKEFEYEWQGAKWRFANAANRDKFAADPQAYAPKYGGFCALAVTTGRLASVDPEAWKVVDGRLYLGWSKASSDKWFENAAANIKKGDEKWAEIIGED